MNYILGIVTTYVCVYFIVLLVFVVLDVVKKLFDLFWKSGIVKILSHFKMWILSFNFLVALSIIFSYDTELNLSSFWSCFLTICLGYSGFFLASEYAVAFKKHKFREHVLNYLKTCHNYDSKYFVWEFSGLNFNGKNKKEYYMEKLEKEYDVRPFTDNITKNIFDEELWKLSFLDRILFLFDIVKNSKKLCEKVIRQHVKFAKKEYDHVQDFVNYYIAEVDKKEGDSDDTI